MGQFNAAYARDAMTACLRSGEVIEAFTEASDVGGLRTGMWADAGTTWIGLTSARMLEVPSANGEVNSTPWSKVAVFEPKAGALTGGRLAVANSTWPDQISEFKVDKGFAKKAKLIWGGPKSALPSEVTTAREGHYQRLNQTYWFCEACGQPCGAPRYSEAPYTTCMGCLRDIKFPSA